MSSSCIVTQHPQAFFVKTCIGSTFWPTVNSPVKPVQCLFSSTSFGGAIAAAPHAIGSQISAGVPFEPDDDRAPRACIFCFRQYPTNAGIRLDTYGIGNLLFYSFFLLHSFLLPVYLVASVSSLLLYLHPDELPRSYDPNSNLLAKPTIYLPLPPHLLNHHQHHQLPPTLTHSAPYN